jgi:hypothetical protein
MTKADRIERVQESRFLFRIGALTFNPRIEDGLGALTIAGLIPLALIAPEPRHAHRCASQQVTAIS